MARLCIPAHNNGTLGLKLTRERCTSKPQETTCHCFISFFSSQVVLHKVCNVVYTVHTVWCLYFAGLYFCDFRKFCGIRENISTKMFETPSIKKHNHVSILKPHL